MKEGSGKDTNVHTDNQNTTDETNMLFTKNLSSHAAFEIEVPSFGDFERQMEFRANLAKSDVVI